MPLSAVSRKTHGGSSSFDVDLPLSGNIGIECRVGQGTNSNDHQVVVNFPTAISLVGTPMVSSGTGLVTTAIASGNQVFINLTGVANAQRIAISMTINDGVNTGPVVVPMGLLLGDVNSSGRVDGTDVSLVRQENFQPLTQDPPTFREDIDASGRVDGTDVSIARQQSFTILP